MKNLKKMVSGFVLVSFLINTAVSDLAFGQTPNPASGDKLAVPSKLDDISPEGIRAMRRMHVEYALQTYLSRIAGGDTSIDEGKLRSQMGAKDPRADSIFKDTSTHFYFREMPANVWALDNSVYLCVRCDVKDAKGTETFYVAFDRNKRDGGFPVYAYSKEELNAEYGAIFSHGDMMRRLAARLPERNAAEMTQVKRQAANNEAIIDKAIADIMKNPNNFAEIDGRANSLGWNGRYPGRTTPTSYWPADYLSVSSGRLKSFLDNFGITLEDALAGKNIVFLRTPENPIIKEDGKKVVVRSHASENQVYFFLTPEAYDALNGYLSANGMSFALAFKDSMAGGILAGIEYYLVHEVSAIYRRPFEVMTVAGRGKIVSDLDGLFNAYKVALPPTPFKLGKKVSLDDIIAKDAAGKIRPRDHAAGMAQEQLIPEPAAAQIARDILSIADGTALKKGHKQSELHVIWVSRKGYSYGRMLNDGSRDDTKLNLPGGKFLSQYLPEGITFDISPNLEPTVAAEGLKAAVQHMPIFANRWPTYTRKEDDGVQLRDVTSHVYSLGIEIGNIIVRPSGMTGNSIFSFEIINRGDPLPGRFEILTLDGFLGSVATAQQPVKGQTSVAAGTLPSARQSVKGQVPVAAGLADGLDHRLLNALIEMAFKHKDEYSVYKDEKTGTYWMGGGGDVTFLDMFNELVHISGMSEEDFVAKMKERAKGAPDIGIEDMKKRLSKMSAHSGVRTGDRYIMAAFRSDKRLGNRNSTLMECHESFELSIHKEAFTALGRSFMTWRDSSSNNYTPNGISIVRPDNGKVEYLYLTDSNITYNEFAEWAHKEAEKYFPVANRIMFAKARMEYQLIGKAGPMIVEDDGFIIHYNEDMRDLSIQFKCEFRGGSADAHIIFSSLEDRAVSIRIYRDSRLMDSWSYTHKEQSPLSGLDFKDIDNGKKRLSLSVSEDFLDLLAEKGVYPQSIDITTTQRTLSSAPQQLAIAAGTSAEDPDHLVIAISDLDHAKAMLDAAVASENTGSVRAFISLLDAAIEHGRVDLDEAKELLNGKLRELTTVPMGGSARPLTEAGREIANMLGSAAQALEVRYGSRRPAVKNEVVATVALSEDDEASTEPPVQESIPEQSTVGKGSDGSGFAPADVSGRVTKEQHWPPAESAKVEGLVTKLGSGEEEPAYEHAAITEPDQDAPVAGARDAELVDDVAWAIKWVKEGEAAIALKAGEQIIRESQDDKYKLLVPIEFFASGELNAEKGDYGDRFKLDAVSGMDNSVESYMKSLLSKVEKGARTIALVPANVTPEQLGELKAKAPGIRFILMRDTNLRDLAAELRKSYRMNVYATMYELRHMSSLEKGSNLYEAARIVVRNCLVLPEGVTVDSCIEAIVNGDINIISKVFLRPIQQIETEKDQLTVSHPLIFA